MATQAGPLKTVTLGNGPLAGQDIQVHEGQPAITIKHDGDQRSTYTLDPITGQYQYQD